jgi:two-component system sensor histidine kinase BaeS
MRSLSVKLTLLFLGIVLISVGIIALWVDKAVQYEFGCYCQRTAGGQGSPNSTCTAMGTGDASSYAAIASLGIPEQAFLSAFRNALWLAALIAVLIAIVLAALLSRIITRPMRQLATAAGKIATGDLSQRIDNISKDEVGEMSAAFNAMAEQLDKKEKSRRQLTADIAHELDRKSVV